MNATGSMSRTWLALCFAAFYGLTVVVMLAAHDDLQGAGDGARRIARTSRRAAGRRVLALELALELALVLPLIPIHAFFGWLISGATMLTLLAVGLARRRVESTTSSELAPCIA